MGMDRYLLFLGPAGSGRTEALRRRYYELVGNGVTTDRILVITASSGLASAWRTSLKLRAHGPLAIWSFFGFVQEEIRAHWGAVQQVTPALRRYVAPEFLNVETAHHLMRTLVEERAPDFAAVGASLQRIAIQIASNLNTVAAANGVPLHQIGPRLEAAATRPPEGGAPVWQAVQACLERYRALCLDAGVLDYGSSLDLYRSVLLHDPGYQEALTRRFRHLLVDDLDESVPVQQEMMEVAAPLMASCAFAFNLDGGQAGFMGAQPSLALQRFRERSSVVELPRSYTCSADMFAWSDALYRRLVTGRKEGRRSEMVVETHIRTDLRGEMVREMARTIADLVKRGVKPSEIAVISPHVDRALETAIRRALPEVAVQNLSLSRRLLDERAARAVVTLASLTHPSWGVPLSQSAVADALNVLLGLDPIRSAVLARAVVQSGSLPDLDEAGLRRRIGFERAEAYDALRAWLAEASQQEWEIDSFCQAVFGELLAPLRPEKEAIHSTQQLLISSHRFRRATERVNPGEIHGREYLSMLLEGTVAADPLTSYKADPDALILATPFAYLTAAWPERGQGARADGEGRGGHLYQVWVDIAADGWFPNDVKELANPHVLSPLWQMGERWADSRSRRFRLQNGAQAVRALARRCKGRLILAESALSSWGMEQDGSLSAAVADLVSFGRTRGGAP